MSIVKAVPCLSSVAVRTTRQVPPRPCCNDAQHRALCLPDQQQGLPGSMYCCAPAGLAAEGWSWCSPEPLDMTLPGQTQEPTTSRQLSMKRMYIFRSTRSFINPQCLLCESVTLALGPCSIATQFTGRFATRVRHKGSGLICTENKYAVQRC